MTDFSPMSAYPGDLCCDFYANPNYAGAKFSYCLSDIGIMEKFDLSEDLSTTPSWWCGKNVLHTTYTYKTIEQTEESKHKFWQIRKKWQNPPEVQISYERLLLSSSAGSNRNREAKNASHDEIELWFYDPI